MRKMCLVAGLLLVLLAGCTAGARPPAVTPPATNVAATGAAASAPTRVPTAETPAGPRLQTLRHPSGLATLSYPSAWQVVDTGNPLFVMVGDYPLAQDQAAPPAGVTAHYVALANQQEETDPAYNRDRLINLAREDLTPTCGAQQLAQKAEDIVIDGQQGIWLHCTGKTGDRTVEASVAYAAHGRTLAAAFTLSYDNAAWDKLKPMFKGIITSLKFTTPAGSS